MNPMASDLNASSLELRDCPVCFNNSLGANGIPWASMASGSLFHAANVRTGSAFTATIFAAVVSGLR
jgi:hypothetical protein